MLRVPRWALTALLALILSVVPFGASWADPGRGGGRDDPPAHGREKEGEDRRQTDDQETDQEAAEDDAVEDSEEQEEAADPPSDENEGEETGSRGSWSRRGSGDGTGARAASAAELVDVSFSASPASISVGQTSTLRVLVANPTDTDAADVTVLVDLPAQLDLVSSRPEATASDVLSLDLGDIAPGGSAEATIVVVGLDAPGNLEPVRFAVTVDDQTFHHELLVEVADAARDGLALTQSSPLLLQVGDTGSFSATVSNRQDAVLRDVAVVTQVAPELDVVGVTPIVQADAVQLGASPRGEDIVWVFESLAPGEEVNMTWTARAAAPGDLEAGNVVAATVAGVPTASSSQGTYLGYVRGVRTERSAEPAPVVREKVVTKLVPVSSEVSASVDGGILPVTGWSPAVLGFGGASLIGLGALLMWSARGLRFRRLALVLVGAVLLTGTACVSDNGSTSSDPDPQAVSSPSPEAAEDEDPKEDQVLGLRIDKPKDGRSADDATATEPAVAGPVEPVTRVVYEEVSEVVTVVVPVAELPLETLGPRAGDNTFSFSWAPGTGDLQGTSGRMLTADATEELLVGLSTQGDRLVASVTLTNLADRRRLHVDGRLTLQVVAADGRSSTLSSDPIDVVLDPGAATVADLAFSLPSGSYSAKGTFVTD